MVRTHRIHGLLPTAALLAGLSASGAEAAAFGPVESTEYLAVWLSDTEGVRGRRPPALLNVPTGWYIGDAAAVLAPNSAWPTGIRERLVAALLASGAAVLELDEPHDDEPRDTALRRDLTEALRELHRIEGAGLMVAIGFGEGGEAALAATEHAEDGGQRYAAGVSLGPGAPLFRRGAPGPRLTPAA